MKYLIVFKAGETFSALAEQLGDFEQWVIQGLGPVSTEVRVIDPRAASSLPPVEEVAGAIITGSHAMVTDKAPWSEALAAWLRVAVASQVPVLGICYGHQLLAHALGGEVDYHPVGLEIGTVKVNLNENAANDLLFGDMPATFTAQAVHRQSVRKLPPGSTLLGGNDFEGHHAFRIGKCAWGIQFHPEFNHVAMAFYITQMAKAGRIAGKPVEAVLEQLAPTEQASMVLKRFGALVDQALMQQNLA